MVAAIQLAILLGAGLGGLLLDHASITATMLGAAALLALGAVCIGALLAPQALALLGDDETVFAGKTPTEDDIVALCKQHDPVALIVRYSRVGAAAIDAAPSLKVISKQGSGTDTIDKLAAQARGITAVAAVGANAATAAEQAPRLDGCRSQQGTHRKR